VPETTTSPSCTTWGQPVSLFLPCSQAPLPGWCESVSLSPNLEVGDPTTPVLWLGAGWEGAGPNKPCSAREQEGPLHQLISLLLSQALRHHPVMPWLSPGRGIESISAPGDSGCFLPHGTRDGSSPAAPGHCDGARLIQWKTLRWSEPCSSQAGGSSRQQPPWSLYEHFFHYKSMVSVGWSCPGKWHWTHGYESGFQRERGRAGAKAELRAWGFVLQCQGAAAKQTIKLSPWYHRAAIGGKILALQTRRQVPEPCFPLVPSVQVISHKLRQWSKTRRRLVQTVPSLPTASHLGTSPVLDWALCF